MEQLRRLSLASVKRGTSPNSYHDLSDQSDSEDVKGPLGLNTINSVPEPLVDFVFVHGLGGGSRKTWAKSKKDGLYWPKDWLKQDPDFKSVRIHSFGYKADWQEIRDSILDINDFALSLLGEMLDNPGIKKSSTRIVLIGHSMGGIVIKKLYLLARQDPKFGDLARRIHSLYFLATPHRGSDIARNLNRIISLVLRKPYVSELVRNSSSIAIINDGFRQYMDDLQLWSFYETLPTKLGMIVDKDSAILGYKNERIALLNADHRGVCKFNSKSDSNYRTLRNSLASTVDTIVVEGAKISREASSADLSSLGALTGVYDRPDDDLMVLDDTRMAGSCEWFTSKREFADWRSAHINSPRLVWLSGNPASGKSVLTSHVIRHLEAQKLACSYFFFKHNSIGKSSVGDCLRSLAFQMACSNDSARSKMLSLEKDEAVWDRTDERTVWRKFFLRCLFLTDSSRPQFWIIDALDECSNFQSLFQFLPRAPIHIRILISSRSTQDIELGFTGLGGLVLRQQICVSDTVEDIRLFIASRMNRLPVTFDDDRKILQDRIIAKSAGSFLWVRLVVQELEHSFSEEEIEVVLNEVPPDMNQLYARILTNMTKETRGTNLAKAILTWTVCASRPLLIHELQYALKLDINETVHNLERSMALICGQLLFIDQSSRVQIIHQTIRDFLLQQEQIPQFQINGKQSQARIAFICLQFLSGDWFKSQRLQRQKMVSKAYAGVSVPNSQKAEDWNLKSAFADYACHFFSDHLYNSSSQDSSALEILSLFLNKNVLSWVEFIASTGDLSYLTHAAKNMKAFLERRAKYSLPISREVETVELWITDLIRVTAKFRNHLVELPFSIHSLIPPLCPSGSIIARTYSARQRGLLVKGLELKTWDDCLGRIDFNSAQTTAIIYGERLFAVGLSTGKIYLYENTSLQEKCIIDHGERLGILRFSGEDRLLASSGPRKIHLWDPISGCQIWSLATSYQAMALMFTADDELLNIACRDNCIRTIKVDDSTEINRVHLIENPHDDFLGKRPLQTPSIAVFSSDCNMLAVSSRGRPILLFDFEKENLSLSYSREASLSPSGSVTHYGVDAIAFNPSSEINVLIASYGDGELTVYDLWSTEPKHRLYEVFAHCLVCSPDGRSLVTGSSRGVVRIFDLGSASGDKLSMIYQIDAPEHGIKALSFSQDSLRFIDIRASQCRIWEPAALIRKDVDRGSYNGFSQSFSIPPKRTTISGNPSAPEITSMCCHPDGTVVFYGRQDGKVLCHCTVDSGNDGVIYSHAANISIVALALSLLSRELRLISADESARFLIKKIAKKSGLWLDYETLADIRIKESINTLLVNLTGNRLLTIGGNTDMLWDLDGNLIYKKESQKSRATTCHPLYPERFTTLGSKVARVFDWADFNEVTQQDGISLEHRSGSTYRNDGVVASVRGCSYFLIENRKVLGKRTSSSFDLWPCSGIDMNCTDVTSTRGFEVLDLRVEHVIDLIGTTLFFLDVDLWICSLDLCNFGTTKQLKRHFFIPTEWRPNNYRWLIYLTLKRDFVFARQDRVIVVRRGLEFSESIQLPK